MRVLAVTADASLEVALAALDDEVQVLSVRDPDAALAEACRSDVALVALGTTERGMSAVETLHRLRVGIPCLVIGEAPSELEIANVLVRPFSMPELIEALRITARARVAPAPPPVEDAPPQAPEPHDLPEVAPEPIEVVAEPPGVPAAEPDADWALALLHEIGQSDDEAAPAPPPPPAQPRVVLSAQPQQWQRPEPSSVRRLRRRRRIMAPVPVGQSRAVTLRRIRAALEGARDLESLVGDMPALADPNATAAAIVREVVDLLGPQTVTLYGRSDSVWEIAAAHGISRAEESLAVPANQPLFADVASRLEAVLVTPVDLVRGFVGGIAGTGVESLMIAPLEVDGTCIGILVAGRAAFVEEDLERIWMLAEEAAPGFAAARTLQRLRRIDGPVELPLSS